MYMPFFEKIDRKSNDPMSMNGWNGSRCLVAIDVRMTDEYAFLSKFHYNKKKKNF